LAFAVAYLSAEELETLHAYAGYVVAGLVLFRIFWGFVGTEHARFGDFVYGPGETIAYLKGLFAGRPRHYLGHNPAGAAMIFLLLFSLIVTCATGLKVYGLEGHGPLAGTGGDIVAPAYAADHNGDKHEGKDAQEKLWEEIHEVAGNATLVFVFIHIAGAIVASLIHRENLIKAMVTGRKASRGSGGGGTR